VEDHSLRGALREAVEDGAIPNRIVPGRCRRAWRGDGGSDGLQALGLVTTGRGRRIRAGRRTSRSDGWSRPPTRDRVEAGGRSARQPVPGRVESVGRTATPARVLAGVAAAREGDESVKKRLTRAVTAGRARTGSARRTPARRDLEVLAFGVGSDRGGRRSMITLHASPQDRKAARKRLEGRRSQTRPPRACRPDGTASSTSPPRRGLQARTAMVRAAW